MDVLMSERSISVGDDKAKFLANMSHEIRTPIGVILGYAQILSRDVELDDQHQRNLDAIIMSARHLQSLINDVMDISKIEAGKMEVNPSVFDVAGLFRTVEAMAKSRIGDKPLAFSVRITESAPPYISTDESKIRQIIVNLVNNAEKYTREGRVEVRVCIEDGHLQVEVEDTGEGIGESDLERIFKPFERCEGDTEQEEGTGLGLAISLQVARLLGGDITAISRVGVGSTFRLKVPVVIPADGHVQVLPPGQGRVTGIEGDPVRILIVDDNREAARLVGQFLESLGFVVQVVFDGASAVTTSIEWRPELILLDQRMPQMDGIEVARQIRADPDQSAKIILVSASVLRDGGPSEPDLADGYISKPFGLEEELLKEISRLTGVAYRYAAEPAVTPTPHVSDDELKRLQMPDAERDELESAILGGDIARILDVVDGLEQLNDAMRAYIRNLALHFKYDTLLVLVQNSDNGDT